MSRPAYSLKAVESVQAIYNGITQFEFHGFPIVDDEGHLIGLITKQNLITLLKKGAWKEKSDIFSPNMNR